MTDSATELIEDIYREGDIDIIFFGQLLCDVSGKQVDIGEAISYCKLPEQRVADAIRLVDFLVARGDFYIQRSHRHEDGMFSYLPFRSGMPEFEAFVWQQFANEGVDGIGLIWTTSIVKILPGRRPPDIPDHIAALVSG